MQITFSRLYWQTEGPTFFKEKKKKQKTEHERISGADAQALVQISPL